MEESAEYQASNDVVVLESANVREFNFYGDQLIVILIDTVPMSLYALMKFLEEGQRVAQVES